MKHFTFTWDLRWPRRSCRQPVSAQNAAQEGTHKRATIIVMIGP